MQLLSALILIHCFDCIFLQKYDNEAKFEKLCTFRSAKNDLVFNANISIVNFNHKRMHDNQGERFSLAELDSTVKDRARVRRKTIPHTFAFDIKECTYGAELVLRWQAEETGRGSFYSHSSRVQRRKLLLYSDNTIYEDPMESLVLRGSNHQFHKGERSYSLSDVPETTGSQNELWDDWGNWSSCSVTCGNGRQVRWRHCSGGSCTKGLKKAQIKTCTLKNCEPKNILHWLGIKSR